MSHSTSWVFFSQETTDVALFVDQNTWDAAPIVGGVSVAKITKFPVRREDNRLVSRFSTLATSITMWKKSIPSPGGSVRRFYSFFGSFLYFPHCLVLV